MRAAEHWSQAAGGGYAASTPKNMAAHGSDIATMNYQQWLDFTFGSAPGEPWQPYGNYRCSDSWRLLGYLDTLFTRPLPALHRYTTEQLERGLWFIPSAKGYLWCWLDTNISSSKRAACVRSALNFHACLDGLLPDAMALHMWWDSVLAYTQYEGRSILEDRDIFSTVVAAIALFLHNSQPRVRLAGEEGAERLLLILEKTKDKRLGAASRVFQRAGLDWERYARRSLLVDSMRGQLC